MAAEGRDVGTSRGSVRAHRTTVLVDGRAVQTLADLPPLRNRLLFVGLSPSPASVAAGHYHQGRGERTFWSRLVAAGVLPPDTPPRAADDALVAAGHGLTDLLKTPTRHDAATDRELTAGVGLLWQKIVLWRPAAVVFIHRRAATIAAGRQLPEPWGQLTGVALSGRPCFLMPDASAPRHEVDDALRVLRVLATTVAEG